jgi:glycosyltransferase involved in cell wall biosynthesis
MTSANAELYKIRTAKPTLAIVINTFNQPEYLRRVLNALTSQLLDCDELLLADDGSEDETRIVFEEWKNRQSIRTIHVWQKKEGFRRSRILNAAIAQARNDYLIFLDGDSVPHPKFASDHRKLAQRGFYIQAHRSFIGQKASPYFGVENFFASRLRAFLSGQIHGWKHVFRWPMPFTKIRSDLRGVRGCNLGIWRDDLVKVNGYNEEFVGWGREDSELALRLINSGVQWLDVRGRAMCYHLWHPPADRSCLNQNIKILENSFAGQCSRCERGLEHHLAASS